MNVCAKCLKDISFFEEVKFCPFCGHDFSVDIKPPLKEEGKLHQMIWNAYGARAGKWDALKNAENAVEMAKAEIFKVLHETVYSGEEDEHHEKLVKKLVEYFGC